MKLSPTEYGDFVLTEPDKLASSLASVLGCRKMVRGGVKYYMKPKIAKQLELLHRAGFWPVKRPGFWLFSRDPTPRALYDAIGHSKKPHTPIMEVTGTEGIEP